MALDVKQGTFQITAADSGTITITGVGFTPKVLILAFSNQENADVNSKAEFSIGVATNTTDEYCMTNTSRNNEGSGTCYRRLSNLILVHHSTSSGTVETQYSFNAFNADGFVLNVVDAPDANKDVGYIALGGSDLINVDVGTSNVGTASGNQSVTGVGFTPNALMTFGGSSDAASTRADDYVFSCGVGTGSAAQHCVSVFDEDGAGTTVSASVYQDDGILCQNDGSSVVGKAELVSLDADGYTINRTNAFPADFHYIYLAMNVGNAAVGEFAMQTGTGNFSETGVGFTPKALICFSILYINTNVEGDLELSYGLTDGTSELNINNVSEDGQGTSDCDKSQSITILGSNYNFSQSLSSSFTFVSFDSDGFTLNQNDADSENKLFGYVVLGESTAVTNNYHYIQNQ